MNANISPRLRAFASAASLQGREHAHNEDQYFVGRITNGFAVHETSLDELRAHQSSDATLLAVADGVSGSARGDHASAEVIRQLATLLNHRLLLPGGHLDRPPARATLPSLPDVRRELEDAFALGHERLRLQHGNPSCTTLTVAYVNYPHLYVAHVGDSRCYLYREGTLILLTSDHTMAMELRGEGIKMDDGSRFDHILTRAMGEATATITPDIGHFALQPDDRLLLCSDGVSDVLSPVTITEVMAARTSPDATADAIVTRAYEELGADDTTAVVADLAPDH